LPDDIQAKSYNARIALLDSMPQCGYLMGDNAKDKLQNYLRNLSEDRVSVALGMARKK